LASFCKQNRKENWQNKLPESEMKAWMYPAWQRAATLDTLDETFLDAKGCIIASSSRFRICPLEIQRE
jgi:hypothetical protein